MDERSFLEETQRQVASGRRVDALVAVYFEGGGVRIENAADGMTRLFYAARRGWCSAITRLLEQGADVNAGWPALHGWTPLHDAAYRGQHDAAVLLLGADARVDEINRYGETALHFAAEHNHPKMCKLLLSRGASLDVRANNGEDPEARALRLGRTATADLLAAVRAAGGWPAYARAPRVQLLMLRILWEQGRAVAPPGLLARLFPHETERRASLRSARKAPAALPKEVFWHIVQFWRSDRDSRY